MSIFANAIAPSAYFWPGVLPLMLGMAFPAALPLGPFRGNRIARLKAKR